jgi:hypothetical protein
MCRRQTTGMVVITGCAPRYDDLQVASAKREYAGQVYRHATTDNQSKFNGLRLNKRHLAQAQRIPDVIELTARHDRSGYPNRGSSRTGATARCGAHMRSVARLTENHLTHSDTAQRPSKRVEPTDCRLCVI